MSLALDVVPARVGARNWTSGPRLGLRADDEGAPAQGWDRDDERTHRDEADTADGERAHERRV